ncbi:MATE family efflux transporter (plasmid) [Jeotgalibaca sp. MA1X17-3]|uniref:MATE family efflux transporter n=1 Tax=Jeotgalibaca sp. MA1X17-3 TaxID=2908211 RepID=UPI001F298E4F|nr:MATE family efflux transporter [Jeotgalibaca sp. MA1X17-3]UJF16804.1 MATE family efflux transporter [Jeotgalibaca sp. MA1X17-3]
MEKTLKRKIYNLAVPATVENILQTLVGFIDTLMISRLGLAVVTGVGVANTILNVYLAIFIAIGIGTSSLIAQKLGAKQFEDAQTVARQSTMMAILIGILFGAITILFGKPILSVMGASNDVLIYSTQFFFIVGGSSLFISLMTIFGSILRASGDTKSPMKVSITTNLLNIALDYILIFGMGPIPALGVVGTSIGTVMARVLGCLLLYKAIKKSSVSFNLSSIFIKSNYNALIKLSIPAGFERLVMRIGQVVYFGLIIAIGSKTFAAHSIAGNIESFVYMPAYGLATAATTLVGNAIGAKEYGEAKKTAFLAVKYGVIVLSLFGVVLFWGAPYFASLFTKDESAITQIITALRIDAFNQPGLAISLVLTGALQGMGDTKTPLYSTAFGMWGLRIVGVIILGQKLQLGIAGVWISIGIDLYIRSLFLIYVFNKNIIKKSIPSNNIPPSKS